MKLSRLRKITWRLVFVYSLVIVLVVFARQDEKKCLRWWFWAGLTVVRFGGWVRRWAAGQLAKSTVLTVTGPYAYAKRRLCVGTFLCMIGFAVMPMGDLGAVSWQGYMTWILLGIPGLGFVA